ncbi:MAG: FeoB-associated Cys-rich membrane protein [Clostridia bacterium]|nr:FeoB-associated Cys-rich membrane protein [Clostridia bacterium]
MNIPTIIISVLISGLVIAIVIKEIKNRKSGKTSCSCGMSCETCGLCKK